MIGQDLIATGIYLISAFILFWLGKLVKDLTTTSYSVREELVEKDNVALGVAMAGYYFGLIWPSAAPCPAHLRDWKTI